MYLDTIITRSSVILCIVNRTICFLNTLKHFLVFAWRESWLFVVFCVFGENSEVWYFVIYRVLKVFLATIWLVFIFVCPSLNFLFIVLRPCSHSRSSCVTLMPVGSSSVLVTYFALSSVIVISWSLTFFIFLILLLARRLKSIHVFDPLSLKIIFVFFFI